MYIYIYLHILSTSFSMYPLHSLHLVIPPRLWNAKVCEFHLFPCQEMSFFPWNLVTKVVVANLSHVPWLSKHRLRKTHCISKPSSLEGWFSSYTPCEHPPKKKKKKNIHQIHQIQRHFSATCSVQFFFLIPTPKTWPGPNCCGAHFQVSHLGAANAWRRRRLGHREIGEPWVEICN